MAHFTTRKRQLVSMFILRRVIQVNKYTMCAYIDRFTKVVLAVGGTNKTLNARLLKDDSYLIVYYEIIWASK